MITNKDLSIDNKNGQVILNGDKYDLVTQGELDAAVKELTDELDTAREQIRKLTTPTLIWSGDATAVGTTYNMTRNYSDFKYLLVLAKTNVEVKNVLIPVSSITSTARIFDDVLSSGDWNATTNAFTFNSCYGIKFTATNAFQLEFLSYSNSNWILRPIAIYGIG